MLAPNTLTAQAALAVLLLAVTACGGGGGDTRPIEPTDPAGCEAMFRERASGPRVTLTGSFPERVGASRRSTFDGKVTIANPGEKRLEAVSASQPEVYVTQAGRIVATPVPQDALGLVVDLAPGAARDLSATGSLRRCADGQPLPPGRYEVHAVLRFTTGSGGEPGSAVGGPWRLVIA